MLSSQGGLGVGGSISRSPLQPGSLQQQLHLVHSIRTRQAACFQARVQSSGNAFTGQKSEETNFLRKLKQYTLLAQNLLNLSRRHKARPAWPDCSTEHVALYNAGRVCGAASSAAAAVTAGGGGNDKVGSGGNGGGGGGGGGNGSSGKGDSMDPALFALLAAAGKSASSLPADMSAALFNGKVTTEILQRYLDLESKFLIGWLLKFPGFRERLLADPSFMVKLGIEVGIGICTKCTAEYTKRGENFAKELDFVGANVVMALIADFMLVWLPAPTLSYAAGAAKAGSPLDIFSRMFAGCPDNAFQKVQSGMPSFTFMQRLGAPVRNGMKLFAVGFGASLIGVGITNALIGLRQLLDPSFVPLNQAQDVVATSMAYGAYMATSSNLRYQMLAGVIEERGIETLFKGNYKLCAVLSFLVRTGNTFLGSLLWVDFVRLLGMQKASH